MNQYPPPYQPPPTPARRGPRTGCIIAAAVAGGLVLLVIIGAVLAALTVHNSAGPGASGSAPAPVAVPGVGQVARDGDFAFTVTKISCGKAAARAISGGGFGEKVPAGAIECIVTMRVSDDKSQAQTFFDSNQYAYDASGRQFSADTQGGVFLKGNQDATQVNPGITIIALVAFQIPKGDQIVRLVLHDSAFSGGVTVRI